jgi:hypothetical protein
MNPFSSAYDIDDETRQEKTRLYAPSSASEPTSSFPLLSCHGPQVIVAPLFIPIWWFHSFLRSF